MRRICKKNDNYQIDNPGRSTDQKFTTYRYVHEYNRPNSLCHRFYYRPHLLAYPFAGSQLASARFGSETR